MLFLVATSKRQKYSKMLDTRPSLEFYILSDNTWCIFRYISRDRISASIYLYNLFRLMMTTDVDIVEEIYCSPKRKRNSVHRSSKKSNSKSTLDRSHFLSGDIDEELEVEAPNFFFSPRPMHPKISQHVSTTANSSLNTEGGN